MAESKGYNNLDEAGKLVMAAFQKKHPEYFSKPGKSAEQLRDEYAKAYLANPNDFKNPYADFMVMLTANSDRIQNIERPPVQKRRPILTDEELSALAKEMEARRNNAAGNLKIDLFNQKDTIKPPAEEEKKPGHRFKTYNAEQAGGILLPIAKEMDAADPEKKGRYVKAAGELLKNNQELGSNIGTERAFKAAGLESPLPPQKIDQSPVELVRDIAKNKDGFFLGEAHGDPETTGFVIKHAKDLKAAGYNTMFLEINAELVADLRDGPGKKPDSPLWKKGGPGKTLLPWRDMILAAEKEGIEVVGYDHVEMTTKSGKPGYDAVMPTFIHTFSGIAQRDEDGEKNIRDAMKTRKGKYLVFGGMSHSGDASEGQFLSDTHNLGLPYKGLNRRLGIPSVDFVKLDAPSGTYKGDGRHADYFIVSDKRDVPGVELNLNDPERHLKPGLAPAPLPVQEQVEVTPQTDLPPINTVRPIRQTRGHK